MKRYPYFKPEWFDGLEAPSPLSATVERTSRFEEVDALGMVWHGRYASYFEDARIALGEKYGIGYTTFHEAGLVVPIKQMHVDYMAPLEFNQRCRITAELFWTEAARMNIVYRIHDMRGMVLTTGYTVQLFLRVNKELCMAKPDFYAEFCERWKSGTLA